MSDPRIPVLDELNARLEDLLAQLEAADRTEDERLGAAWSACAATFERFRRLEQEGAGERPAPVRERMETALRLHGVAASLAQRSREGISISLESLAAARQTARAAGRDEVVGGTCDMSG